MSNKILIIGGCGYLGSRLFEFLINNNYRVDTVDLEWFGNFSNKNNIKKDYKSLSPKFLKKYDVVILLAGNSSIPMSEKDMVKTFKNNVSNFVDLLNKIGDQKFIYASSSSVYGSTKRKQVKEDYDRYTPTNYYDLSKKEIDYYAHLSNLNYFGLRMGTVCGYSPNLRIDVMINKMYNDALSLGEIKIFNKNFFRPILGINDFCRAVETLIKKNKESGIYNLASFNMTIENIAKNVSKRLENTTVKTIGNNATYYDFSVSSRKFEVTFSFKFKDSITDILDSLEKKYPNVNKTLRL